jgi:hypothetical protein
MEKETGVLADLGRIARLEKRSADEYVDIRKDDLYTKIGGANALIDVAIFLGIPVYGTRIRMKDLELVIAAHNERNPEAQLRINANDAVEWHNASGRISQASPLESRLDDGIFGEAIPVRSYAASPKPVQADNTARPADVAVRPTEMAGEPACEKPVTASVAISEQPANTGAEASPSQRADKTLLDQYILIISRRDRSPENVKDACTLLERMCEQKGRVYRGVDLDALLDKTQRFVYSHKNPQVMNVIDHVFNLMNLFENDRFTQKTVDTLDRIQRRLSDVDYGTRGSKPGSKQRLAVCYLLSEANKKAFFTYRRLKHFKSSDKRTRISALHYLRKVESIYRMTNDDKIKEAALGDAIEFCEQMADSKTPKDDIMRVNINYFRTLFCIEKYSITRDPNLLRIAGGFLDAARKDLEEMDAQRTSSEVIDKFTRDLDDFETRLGQYERNIQ